jgi:hypothetical protein
MTSYGTPTYVIPESNPKLDVGSVNENERVTLEKFKMPNSVLRMYLDDDSLPQYYRNYDVDQPSVVDFLPIINRRSPRGSSRSHFRSTNLNTEQQHHESRLLRQTHNQLSTKLFQMTWYEKALLSTT